MSLPRSVPESDVVVTLSGGDQKIRSLSVREVRRVQAIKDEETADIVCIALATGEDEAAVRAWIETAIAGDLNKLIRAIFEASGMGKDAEFPS